MGLLQDKGLRAMLYGHIVNDIKGLNEKGRDPKVSHVPFLSPTPLPPPNIPVSMHGRVSVREVSQERNAIS